MGQNFLGGLTAPRTPSHRQGARRCAARSTAWRPCRNPSTSTQRVGMLQYQYTRGGELQYQSQYTVHGSSGLCLSRTSEAKRKISAKRHSPKDARAPPKDARGARGRPSAKGAPTAKRRTPKWGPRTRRGTCHLLHVAHHTHARGARVRYIHVFGSRDLRRRARPAWCRRETETRTGHSTQAAARGMQQTVE